jgi:hypothetical protein
MAYSHDVNIQRHVLIAALVLCAGCSSPHGGPVLLVWAGERVDAIFPPGPIITGTNGSSLDTALRVQRVSKDDVPGAEKGYVYQTYWLPLEPPRSLQEFDSSSRYSTERIGKRVYDIVTVTLTGGETRTVYFDVTNYRYFWPKDK